MAIVGNPVATVTASGSVIGQSSIVVSADFSEGRSRRGGYIMRQIPFGGSSVPLHFEFPIEWDPTIIKSVTLAIKDRDGVELLAAQDLTLWTQTTLDGSTSRYADSLILNDVSEGVDPDLLRISDPILIASSVGDERHRVKGYNQTTKVVQIEGILENDHDDNEDIYGLFGDYNLDLSSATDFPAGILITLIWTPLGLEDVIVGPSVTAQVQVATSSVEIPGLERRFSRNYKRAYNDFKVPTDIFADMAEEAEIQVSSELSSLQPPIDIHRIVDKELVTEAIMARMAWIWAMNGDQQREDERKVIKSEYERAVAFLKARSAWQDNDQDLIETEEETTSHEPIFGKGW